MAEEGRRPLISWSKKYLASMVFPAWTTCGGLSHHTPHRCSKLRFSHRMSMTRPSSQVIRECRPISGLYFLADARYMVMSFFYRERSSSDPLCDAAVMKPLSERR